jgi:hypothetical protein
MAFSLVTHLILEPFGCSILKLTKSWGLARLPSTRHNHIVSLFFECAVDEELGEEIFEDEV